MPRRPLAAALAPARRLLASLALAGTLLPLTFAPCVGWADDDDDKKKQQKRDEQQAAQREADGRPDLKIEFAGFNAPGAGNQLVTFKVSNIGTDRSSAVSARVVTLEPEPTPHRRDLDVASLPPGASAELVYPLAAPCDGHRVLATVDDPLDAQSANNRAEAQVCPAAASPAGLARPPGGAGDRSGESPAAVEAIKLPPGTIVCCFEAEPSTPAAAGRTGQPGITTRAPIVAGDKAVYVEAGATGDGPADQDECDKWASAINTGIDQLKTAFNDGDGARAEEWASELEHLEEKAMARGCFIVY